MELLAADVVARFYTFLWPMLRISALMVTAPVFALRAFNLRLRVLLAIVLAWLVYPMHTWPVIDPVSAAGLKEIINQLAIGAIAGLILQMVVAAMVVGGQAIATSMGLSMANLMDPNMGNVPVISQFLIVLGSLIFVGMGGHVILLGMILESFHTLPIGTSIFVPESMGLLLRWSSMMFLGAVLMSLPVMVALLFVNIGVGVITRAAPSLNIFSVGFPASVAVGFIVLLAFMGSIIGRIDWMWLQGFSTVRELLGVPRV
ncbi:MAG: Flagellar biosynthetic protein FliR [Pseudomonadota bacterium]|jgi:flagellar biosynthetic protein FliR